MNSLIEELTRVREMHGMLTPRTVLEDARNPESPLHHRFTWDNDEAAERWRLQEAARLLRVTFRTTVSGRPADLRAFWVVKGDEHSPESQYVPTPEVAVDPIAKRIMLQQMRRDWQRFRARYEVYTEFFEMIAGDWPADWPPLTGNGSEG